MVVDDVEDDGEPARVGGVDEAAQAVGAAVRLLRREPVDAVVAPVARAGEAGDRQDLDGGDAELDSRSSAPMAASNVPSGVKVPTCSS